MINQSTKTHIRPLRRIVVKSVTRTNLPAAVISTQYGRLIKATETCLMPLKYFWSPLEGS